MKSIQIKKANIFYLGSAESNERLSELLSESDNPDVVENRSDNVDFSKYDILNRPWGEGGTA